MSTTPKLTKREEALALEYFSRKVEATNEVLSASEWFLEGIRYGREQTYVNVKPDSYSSNNQAAQEWVTGPKRAAVKDERNFMTLDEFKAKYGEYGEKYKYKPQTDPDVPWDPNWDIS